MNVAINYLLAAYRLTEMLLFLLNSSQWVGNISYNCKQLLLNEFN